MKRAILLCLIMVWVSRGATADVSCTSITEIEGKSLGYVKAICAGNNGDVWLCSYNSGYDVFRYDGTNWHDESDRFDGRVEDIAIDDNSDVWFSCYDKLVCYSEGEWTYIETPQRIMDIDVHDGIVWCCSDGYVRVYDGTGWSFSGVIEGLKDWANHIVTSPEGTPWVSYGDPYAIDGQSFHGVSYFTGESWETFDTTNGLPTNYVVDIAFDSSGSMYVSCGTKGLMKYSGGVWTNIASVYGGFLMVDYIDNLWIKDSNVWQVEPYLNPYLYKYDGVSLTSYQNDTWAASGYHQDVDSNGRLWFSKGGGIIIVEPSALAVENEKTLRPYSTITNYPNPFNPSTTISFSISKAGSVSLSVYDLSGQKVATLVDGPMSAGAHAVQFDGTGLASGIYVYRLESAGYRDTGKMLLVK